MNIEASVTISRDSRDVVRIRVRDENAVMEFLTIEMTPHDFAMAITGLSSAHCRGEVRRLDVVGKTRKMERRTAICPIQTYDKSLLSDWLKDNCAEDGWEIQTYLGSQSSIVRVDGVTRLNYSVVSYE